MVGPVGAGKTMLANRAPGLLPPLAPSEAAEVEEIYTRRKDSPPPESRRPFRTPPPHTTAAALIGGGRGPTPGEVSLAHRGVLFLDELPLFRREALDGLRGPMDRGQVSLQGLGRTRSFPSRFILIGTMNPCPCGWRGDARGACTCSAQEVLRYLRPISGALLDRMDLIVLVPHLSLKELRSSAGESSETVAERIVSAWRLQHERCSRLNAALSTTAVRFHCCLDAAGRALLDRAIEKLGFTARAVTSVLRVARTIADLQWSDSIRPAHLAEAIQYKGQASPSPLI
jgi:magnesium chelatase family protein